MNVEIKLTKRVGTYEKDGKTKQYTNIYVCVNGDNIPVEVKYFPKKEFGDRDPNYQGRVMLLSSLAELLPEVPVKEKPQSINPRQITCPKCSKVMRVDDQDGSEYYLVCDECGISCNVDTKVGELSFTDSDGNELPF